MRHIRTPLAILSATMLVIAAVIACGAPHDGADVQQQDQPSQQRIDPAPDVPTVKPTANGPAAQPQTGTTQTADELFDEQMRWCKAWALDNLEPLAYVEFLELDPLDMDDIDRSTWRARLTASPCRELYGSEPLNASNADRRNEQFKLDCLSHLSDLVDFQWSTLGRAAYGHQLNPTAHEIPNQYVRIMRWMHLSGEELLDMEEPPRELLERLRKYDYSSGINRTNTPTAGDIEAARAEHGDDFSIDWWGLHTAATDNNASTIGGCRQYFPQLFYGRWIPRAQPPRKTPTPSHAQQDATDALHADVQRILDGSLYLPRP